MNQTEIDKIIDLATEPVRGAWRAAVCAANAASAVAYTARIAVEKADRDKAATIVAVEAARATWSAAADAAKAAAEAKPPGCITCAALLADIEYVRDRLTSRDDTDRNTIGIRDLIDEATGNGDFFPAYEWARQKEEQARQRGANRIEKMQQHIAPPGPAKWQPHKFVDKEGNHDTN